MGFKALLRRCFFHATKQEVIEAKYFAENNPTIGFACGNTFEEMSLSFNISDGFIQAYKDQITINDDVTLHVMNAEVQRPIKPGAPFVFHVYCNSINKYKQVAILQLVDATVCRYEIIPLEASADTGFCLLKRVGDGWE